MSRIVYFLPCRPGTVYVNITENCLNDCRFCIKRKGTVFFGQDMSLKNGPPSANEIVKALRNIRNWPTNVREIVFCGMGEPLLCYENVLTVCSTLKLKEASNLPIRIDTSGLYWSVNKRLDLLEFIDVLNVSLNAEEERKYEELCRPKIKNAYNVLIEFLNAVKKFEIDKQLNGLRTPKVYLSVVNTAEERYIPISGRQDISDGMFPVPDIDACARIAKRFGWELLVKRLFRDSTDVYWNGETIGELCLTSTQPEACRVCLHRH